jgi:hypothetical protein
LWRHHLQIQPSPRVAVEDMVVAAAVSTAVVVVSTAVVAAFMAVAFMAEVVSTVAAEASMAEPSMSEDFTAADSMVEDFAAARFTAADFMAARHMPFALLHGRQDGATVRATFRRPLKSDLAALARRMFLEVPSPAATPPQAERLRATPAR